MLPGGYEGKSSKCVPLRFVPLRFGPQIPHIPGFGTTKPKGAVQTLRRQSNTLLMDKHVFQGSGAIPERTGGRLS